MRWQRNEIKLLTKEQDKTRTTKWISSSTQEGVQDSDHKNDQRTQERMDAQREVSF